jgi:predicted ATPase/DNA-binding SARP family transcriptional activator
MDLRWHIELLGDLRASLAGHIVTRFRSRQARSLLALLAYHPGRAFSRDQLAELFWPEAEPEAARLSLRVALSSLRRQLEPPGTPRGSVIAADRGLVRLNAAAMRTDISEFHECLRGAEHTRKPEERVAWLTRALELYRGELLPGCYDEWVVAEREMLASRCHGALRQLSAVLEQLGELDRAIACARRAVQSDPLDEGAHLEVIRLCVAAGRADEARRQYAELERTLRAEFGTTPGEAARGLVMSVGAAEAPASPRCPLPEGNASRRPAAAPGAPPCPPLLFLTRFVGRERELGQLAARLAPGDRTRSEPPRLVTLLGPGGVGKTRLALEVAARAREAFPGGVWVVRLVDQSEPGLLLDTIADGMGLERRAGVAHPDQLSAALIDRTRAGRFLLVLDNFEHLLPHPAAADSVAATSLALLMQQVAGIHCLVTSRCRLGIAGELEVPVPPLAVPPDESTGDISGGAPAGPYGLSRCPAAESLRATELQALAACPSVALFLDRARTAAPDFSLTARNAAAVANICRRLEGLPLALELAAGWTRMLSPAQIAARLASQEPSARRELLVSRDRNALPRHRSLQAALAWSCEPLPPALRQFFARLSVFRGGFTLAAAEAVAGRAAGVASPLGTLSALADLRDASLIVAEKVDGETRYRMLDTVRDHAAEHADPGMHADAAVQHALFFLALAENAERELRGPDQKRWVQRLEAEYPNLTAALEWGLSGSRGLGGGPAGVGVRLAAALAGFWLITARFAEGGAWLERALAIGAAAPEPVPDELRARLLLATAVLAALRGDADRARARSAEGRDICRSLTGGPAEAALLPVTQPILLVARAGYQVLESLAGLVGEMASSEGRAFAAAWRGLRLLRKGGYDEAAALLDESLALYRALGDSQGLAAGLLARGEIDVYRGDRALARRRWEEALAIHQGLGDRIGIAQMLGVLAYLARLSGDCARAEGLLKTAAELNREMGYRAGLAGALWGLGNVAAFRGDYPQAELLLEESRALGCVWDATASLALVALYRGDLRAARRLAEEALEQREGGEDRLDIAFSQHTLGLVALHEGDHSNARAHFERALGIGREMQSKAALALANLGLGAVDAREGHAGTASGRLEEALALFEEQPDPRGAAACLEALAGVRRMQGVLEAAAECCGAAAALRERIGAPLPPCDRPRHERLLLSLRAELEAPAFAAAFAKGAASIGPPPK